MRVAVLALLLAIPVGAVADLDRERPAVVEASEAVFAWVDFGFGGGCLKKVTALNPVWGGFWYDYYPYDVSVEWVDVPPWLCVAFSATSPHD